MSSAAFISGTSFCLFEWDRNNGGLYPVFIFYEVLEHLHTKLCPGTPQEFIWKVKLHFTDI